MNFGIFAKLQAELMTPVKRIEKVKEVNIDPCKVIAYFSEKRREYGLGQKDLKCTFERKQAIINLVKSGATRQEIKQAIDGRFSAWANTDFSSNLTPETIFRKSNFFKYVEAAEKVEETTKTWMQ